MFSSLAYAIVLMGCSDDMSICRETSRYNRVFATLAQCEQAQDVALMSDVALEIDYPTVAAKCVQNVRIFADKGQHPRSTPRS
jgi:hypothetical protein